MKLTIKHQDTYSRGQLLLRSFFGVLYILIPHAFCFFFVGIWAAILMFLAWWVILFTAKFPRNWYEFMVGFYNWQARVNASLWNLVDGYPAFFPSGTSDSVKLESAYPETLSRKLLLLRLFFGGLYVGIPHGICLFIRSIVSDIL